MDEILDVRISEAVKSITYVKNTIHRLKLLLCKKYYT